MRTLLALPAFYLVSRAPLVAEIGVGVGLLVLLGDQGMPLPTSLTVLAIGLLGVFAVRLAVAAPMLRTTNGGRRTVEDACWQAADAVADWAGWLPAETPNDSH